MVDDGDEEEELILATPVDKNESELGGKRKRRRVRKKVEKTYTDEEGFTVTKMETVSASESEKEDGDEVLLVVPIITCLY